jgi:hypothetical protein
MVMMPRYDRRFGLSEMRKKEPQMLRISPCIVFGVFIAYISAPSISAQEPQSIKGEQRLLAPEQEAYSQVKSLEKAIDALRLQLADRGENEFASLFSVESVKHAIKTSILGMEREHTAAIQRARSDNERAKAMQSAEYFQKAVKPIYEQIADSGTWPPGAFFMPTPKRPMYSSFTVNLHVDMRGKNSGAYEVVPGLKPTGHAIRILSIDYGFVGPPAPATLKFNLGKQ